MSDRGITPSFINLIRIAEEYAPYVFQLYSSIHNFFNFLFDRFLWIIVWMASRDTKPQPKDQTPRQTQENQHQISAPAKTNSIKNGELPSLACAATSYFLSVALLSAFSENPRNTFFSIIGGTLACVIIMSSEKPTLSPKQPNKTQSTTLTEDNNHPFFAQNRKKPVEHSVKPLSPISGTAGTIGAATGFALSTASDYFFETKVSMIAKLMFAVAGFFAFAYAYSFLSAPKKPTLSLFWSKPTPTEPPAPNANACDPRATR